jgi:hypothetical protein
MSSNKKNELKATDQQVPTAATEKILEKEKRLCTDERHSECAVGM